MSNEIRSTIQKRDDKGDIRHGGEWLSIWSDPESVKTKTEKKEDQKRELQLDVLKTQISASVRSLSGKDHLDILFGDNLNDTEDRVVLRPIGPNAFDIIAIRGEADAKACFLRYHEPKHFIVSPNLDQNVLRMLLIFEHSRCEAVGAINFHGIADNLVAWHKDQLKRSDLLNAHLASLIPLSEALKMVLRDVLLGRDQPSIQTAGFRMWNTWLRQRFEVDFQCLKTLTSNQLKFIEMALAIVNRLFGELPSKSTKPKLTKMRPTEIAKSEEDINEAKRKVETKQLDDADIIEIGDLIFLPEDDDIVKQIEPVKIESSYRIYTTQYDKIVSAEKLQDKGALREARRLLDDKQSEFRQKMLHLVTRLQRRLLAKQARKWEFDLDDGLLDAARLDRVILSPDFSNAYKQEAESLFKDTIVTLLIDNSGSMRGKPVEIACTVADILAAALEKCSVSTEILGFTTSAWKGGKSAQDWAKAGKPEHPGRLNDLLHIIYKDANEPFRHARDNICAMLSSSLLKENIDGEALYWASMRMMQRPEQRKLLIVISDGAPVDQFSLEKNQDKMLLDRHLRDMIKYIGTSTTIELFAIGIKHDVSNHYKNAVQINDVLDLGKAIIDLLDQSLTGV